MFSTDAMDYGNFPFDFLIPDDFSWPYPTGCGYQSATQPVLLEGKTGTLYYLLTGGGTLQSDEQSASYTSDCVCIAPQKKDILLSPAEPTEYLYISLEWACSFLEKIAQGQLVRQISAESRADRLLGRICYHAFSKSIQDIYAASADVYALLMEILSSCAQKQGGYPPLIEQALELIRQDYAFLSGVDEIAQILGVSKSHLIRNFSSAVGISPGKYLQSIKLDNAKLMLQNRDYSIEMVADMVGYSGANYFCKVFRRETGETPGQYRARHLTPSILDAESRRRIEELEGIYHI